jgi:hypothetical protein
MAAVKKRGGAKRRKRWLYIRMDRQPPLSSLTGSTMDDSHLFFRVNP